MTAAGSTTTERPSVHAIRWGAPIAGALIAAGTAFVLHGFAISIGLAVVSTAPTWRDASAALWLVSGLYLVLVAIVSYGAGGYVAGRLREPLAGASADETEFRDGTHGLIVWAIATIVTALLVIGTAQAVTRLAAPSAGASGPATSVGAENIIAYDLDRLFRAEQRPQGINLEYRRAEAGRILMTASGNEGMSSEDRSYLVQLVASSAGLSNEAAAQRVAQVTAQAAENIARARRASLLVGFMAAAAALLGAAVAWFAACAGGVHRDGKAPSLRWGRFGRQRAT